MDDLIRRQDALKPFCTAPDGTRIPEVDCDNLPVEFSVEFIKKHLLSLPSADADIGEYADRLWKIAYERGKADAEWIPCSEKLPSERGWYLITVQGMNRFTDMDYYYGNSEWDEVSSKQKVIAWMPLPEPYREENEE